MVLALFVFDAINRLNPLVFLVLFLFLLSSPSTIYLLVSMISLCDATSSSVLGRYFSTQGADAAVAAARASTSADDAAPTATAGALPLASAFAAAAAALEASAVEAGASAMSASVILKEGERENRKKKERESPLFSSLG
jgi:hypothetical protein